MGHRTVKRVPMDFDWPTGKVWDGYLMGPGYDWPTCRTCGGDGQTVEARAIAEAFYGFAAPDSMRWSDKLGQAEVDNLWEEGRLNRWNRETRKWERGDAAPSAAEVNESNRSGSGMSDWRSHDAINRWILVSFRCKRLGIEEKCPTCAGHGNIATDEQRASEDAWKATEPPTGDGWQLWETTTEGSPVSPVFASARALAEWCEGNASAFADMKMTAGEWLRSFEGGTTDVDTLLVATVE